MLKKSNFFSPGSFLVYKTETDRESEREEKNATTPYSKSLLELTSLWQRGIHEYRENVKKKSWKKKTANQLRWRHATYGPRTYHLHSFSPYTRTSLVIARNVNSVNKELQKKLNKIDIDLCVNGSVRVSRNINNYYGKFSSNIMAFDISKLAWKSMNNWSRDT